MVLTPSKPPETNIIILHRRSPNSIIFVPINLYQTIPLDIYDKLQAGFQRLLYFLNPFNHNVLFCFFVFVLFCFCCCCFFLSFYIQTYYGLPLVRLKALLPQYNPDIRSLSVIVMGVLIFFQKLLNLLILINVYTIY